MKIWMVAPRLLCRAHLLGEHRAIHILVRNVAAKRDAMVLEAGRSGSIPRLPEIPGRHDALVAEMLRRGWKGHKTPIDRKEWLRESFLFGARSMERAALSSDFAQIRVKEVNMPENARLLYNRCADCRALQERDYGGKGAFFSSSNMPGDDRADAMRHFMKSMRLAKEYGMGVDRMRARAENMGAALHTYVKFYCDGTTELIRCTSPLSMEALQGHVGGYVQMFGTLIPQLGNREVCAAVNEDGHPHPNLVVRGLKGHVVIGERRGGDFCGFSDEAVVGAIAALGRKGG